MTHNDYTQRPLDALPAGYRFDEFEIQDVIDASNDNIVYRALDHQLDRQVAIREFLPRTLMVRSDSQRLLPRSQQDHSAFSDGLARFTLDARQLARLNHPNVVQILRFWTWNETAYAATPVYSGVTLATFIQQHPEQITPAWVQRLLPMLCSALAALHEKGFIHCRLSLNSILIQDNDVPLLLEFGALRQEPGNDDEVNKMQLRPGFTPLEQYSDERDENPPGPWTDIYSLGAILYTLITGSRPPASVTRTIHDSLEPLAERQPDGYSPALLQAVDQALALKPEERPQTLADFATLAGLPRNEESHSSPHPQTGSMLVPMTTGSADFAEEPAAAPWWKPYRTPLQVAAGVVAGLIVGGVIFGRTTSTAETEIKPSAPAQSGVSASQTVPPGTTENRIYVQVESGDQLEVNGKAQKLPTPVNGYSLITLAPGQYDITLRNERQSRTSTISVDKPGTWLINPQP